MHLSSTVPTCLGKEVKTKLVNIYIYMFREAGHLYRVLVNPLTTSTLPLTSKSAGVRQSKH